MALCRARAPRLGEQRMWPGTEWGPHQRPPHLLEFCRDLPNVPGGHPAWEVGHFSF